METKTWEELVKARFEHAKERLVESERRLAYMSPEDMSLVHEKVRASLEVLEAELARIGEYTSETQQFAVMRAEIQFGKTEVQLARSEAELLAEMIEFDMSISQESKVSIRFLAEEAVRLAEAKVRLVEAELQLAEAESNLIDPEMFMDAKLWEAAKYLHDADMWLLSDEPAREGLSWEEAHEVLYNSQQYQQMEAIHNDLSTKAGMNLKVAIAAAEVRLAKLRLQLAEAKLQLAEAELMLGETYNSES